AEPLMLLYAGSDYVAAGFVMLVLLCRYPFVYASSMYYRVSHAMGAIRGYYLTQVAIQLTACVLTAALVIWMDLGALGAAQAISATDALSHVLGSGPVGVRLRAGSGGRVLRSRLLPGLVRFAASLAGCAGAERYMHPHICAAIGGCTAISVG